MAFCCFCAVTGGRLHHREKSQCVATRESDDTDRDIAGRGLGTGKCLGAGVAEQRQGASFIPISVLSFRSEAATQALNQFDVM